MCKEEKQKVNNSNLNEDQKSANGIEQLQAQLEEAKTRISRNQTSSDSANKKKRDSTSTSIARTVNLSVIPVASPTLRAEIHVDTQTRVRASAHFSSIQPPYKYRSVDGVIFQLPELTTRTVTETQPKTKHTQTNKNGAGTLPTE